MRIKHSFLDYLNIFKHTALGVSFPVWIQILVQHRFAIGWRFLPKAMFITATSIVNIPFQLIEYFLYHKKIKATVVKRPIFILGHPRSGTTYLHYLISADPNLAFCTTNDAIVPHLMLTTGRITEKILDRFMPATRPQDNVKAGAKMPKEEEFALANTSSSSFMHGFYFPRDLKKVFDRDVLFNSGDQKVKKRWQRDFHYFIQKLTYKNKGKQLVLKSPANTGRLKEIYELYPDAIFIHIHRDPYAVYQSNAVLYDKVLPILDLQHVDRESISDFIIASFRTMYEKYLKDKTLIPPAQIRELRYEDFVKDPLDCLDKCYQELGIGDFEKVRTYIESEVKEFGDYKKNKHQELTKDIRDRIEKEWAFFFEEYEYNRAN
ncbi:sulfotransferase family protein [Reichenbachiella ulvae]|uniref:Sulfotransferase n=1 Tax=Reichenbachiella ulvae TaxID=2980104 RepID=A0ABT3CVV2_9BACT|nr:sulfotransferase [Reichenbachiella ulvae]MCV9387831.1 sulfotransferase [Reichenbachiella ulvae]